MIERGGLMGWQADDDPGPGDAPGPGESLPDLLAAFEHGGAWDAAAPSARSRRRWRPPPARGAVRGRGGGRAGRDRPAVGGDRVVGGRGDARRAAGHDARGRRGPAAAAPPQRPARRVDRLPQLRDRRRPGHGPGLGGEPRRPGLDPRHAPARHRPAPRRRHPHQAQGQAHRPDLRAPRRGRGHPRRSPDPRRTRGQDLVPGRAAGLARRPRRRPRRRRTPPVRGRTQASPGHAIPRGIRRGRPVRPRPAHRRGPVRPRQRPRPRRANTKHPAPSPATTPAACRPSPTSTSSTTSPPTTPSPSPAPPPPPPGRPTAPRRAGTTRTRPATQAVAESDGDDDDGPRKATTTIQAAGIQAARDRAAARGRVAAMPTRAEPEAARCCPR